MARAPKNKKLPRKKAGRKSTGQGSVPTGGSRQDRTLRPLERLLFEAAGNFSGDYILLTSTAGAQAAAEVARRNPNAEVTCNYFDVFLAQAAKKRWEDVENFGVTCLVDLPEGRADCVGLALPARGENELARDLIQTAHLRMGATPETDGAGRLIVSTDNPKDKWVHEQLSDAFSKVTVRSEKDGRLYIAAKPKPLKKLREFQAWFAFRDKGRLFDVMSRPGVFSHRKLDLGARALIESLSILDGKRSFEVVQSGMKILDLGCGTGAVGFAASARADSISIHALDANARAVQCAQAGAEKNGLTKKNYSTQLECDGECKGAGTFDLVLANPPYFSKYRIAEAFLKATRRALKPGGRTHFVTKQPKWYIEKFASVFEDVSVREVRGYFIVKGTQPKKKRQASANRTSTARKEKAAKKTPRGNIPKSKTKTSKQARQKRPQKAE